MRPLGLGLSTALMAFAVTASADVAPPPNYVETCTIARQQHAGEECRECGTYYAEHDKCDKTLGTEGFSRRCRTRGASVWTEVWCRSANAPRPQPDPDPHSSDPTYAKPPPGPIAIATDPAAQTPSDPAPIAASDPPSAPPPVPARSGCGSCSIGASPRSSGALMAAAIAAIALAARRRRS